MHSNGKPTFRQMMEEVVQGGRCSGCGACVIACPYDVLHYEAEKPLQRVLGSLPSLCPVAECIECDICADVCPRLGATELEIDKLLFGRERDAEEEPFGVHTRVFYARTNDPRIAAVAQDGGVVTVLLNWALERGLIDGALVSGITPDSVWVTEPRVARNLQELMDTAGSRYTYSPNPLAMLEAVNGGGEKLALVGTPCEISSVGKARLYGVEEYSSPIVFTVGLLCAEAFTFDGLMQEKIVKELGIPLEDVTKINIKGKVLVYTRSGEIHEIPLKEAKLHGRPECHFCADFSAEHADISAGGLGMDGWTVVILRSRKGEEIFDGALAEGLLETLPIEAEPKVQELLLKMVRRQKRRAAKALSASGIHTSPGPEPEKEKLESNPKVKSL